MYEKNNIKLYKFFEIKVFEFDEDNINKIINVIVGNIKLEYDNITIFGYDTKFINGIMMSHRYILCNSTENKSVYFGEFSKYIMDCMTNIPFINSKIYLNKYKIYLNNGFNIIQDLKNDPIRKINNMINDSPTNKINNNEIIDYKILNFNKIKTQLQDLQNSDKILSISQRDDLIIISYENYTIYLNNI